MAVKNTKLNMNHTIVGGHIVQDHNVQKQKTKGPISMKSGQDIYISAKEVLLHDRDIGKQRLARQLGINNPSARRLLARFRGETQGHSHDPVYQRVRDLKEQQPNSGAGSIARELHISEDNARVHLARWLGAQSYVSEGEAHPPPPLASPSSELPNVDCTFLDSVGQTTRDLHYCGLQVSTVDELLSYAKVDTSIWAVERGVAKKWEVGARHPATCEILTSPLFQVKAWLRRKIVEVALKDFHETLKEELKKEAPTRPAIRRALAGDGMLEIALTDLHYGELVWGEECGRDYNPEIAGKLFWTAMEDFLDRSAGMKVAKFLFPVGNDFYHADILGRMTTAGFPVDTAIGWKQAFVQGWRLLAQGIERLRMVAPVHVVVVNGNHDVQSAFHLGEVLQAWFHRTEGVIVDNSPTQRKYVTHHKCLLGLTHGSEERHSSLPLLMASERPADWASSNPGGREFHIGHFHHKKSLKFVPAEDVSGVLVRVIPSLTPLDGLHASKGYNSKLAAEAFYWDPECGVTTTLTHSPR